MERKVVRGAVVGATTLLGKELAEELNRAADVAWDLLLLDTEEAGGQITSAGDEALVVQTLRAEAFDGVDVIFFAGETSTAVDFFGAAQAAGAAVVDLTGALEGQANVIVRSPLVPGGSAPALTTLAVVPAHPVAVILAGIAEQLQSAGVARLAATVLLPASELGNNGVDELHQQTVSLLSFKPLKKETFDTQVAFSTAASMGDSSKLNLQSLSQRILDQVSALRGHAAKDWIALQLVQAPVFHGYTASIFLELASPLEPRGVSELLRGKLFKVDAGQSPSNEGVAGDEQVLVSITPVTSPAKSAYWLWLAADNLRLLVRNAAACATELIQLRPDRIVH